MPEDRIAQIAKLASEDPGKWLLLIRAEQTTGEVARGWASIAKRYGIAAAVALVVVALPALTGEADTLAATLTATPFMHYAKWLVVAAITGAALWSIRGRSPASLLA